MMSVTDAIGNIYLNSGIRGSGVLVGPNDLLTCVHVALDASGAFEGGAVQFDGGALSANLIGVQYIDDAALWTNRSSVQFADIPNDLALITLDRPIGDTLGWFGLDGTSHPGTVQVSGYPGAPYSGQTLTTDAVAADYTSFYDVIHFSSQTIHPGSSGGPLYEMNADGSASVVGLTESMTPGTASDYATMLTPQTVSLIESWIAANGTGEPTAEATTTPAPATIAVPNEVVDAALLYEAALNRDPTHDPAGFAFWANGVTHGLSLTQMADGFLGSTEFVSRFGDPLHPTAANGLDDASYVTLLYHNALNREPDAGGYAFWLHDLAGGDSREQVLIDFAESPENVSTAPEIQHIVHFSDGSYGFA